MKHVTSSTFSGFPAELLTFYQELSENNNRDWFENHKKDYEQHVLAPASAFVGEMGVRLRVISTAINADTRLNGAGSIFRIYRDTRFAKDKTPYKTHLGIYFWAGNLPKKENPGFYLQIEHEKLLLFAGIHKFGNSFLSTYRESVSKKKDGVKLLEAINKVKSKGSYKIGGRHFKRIPPGYDASQSTADLLLYNGLYATIENDIPSEFYKADLVDYCLKRFKDMSPVFYWLSELINRGM